MDSYSMMPLSKAAVLFLAVMQVKLSSSNLCPGESTVTALFALLVHSTGGIEK